MQSQTSNIFSSPLYLPLWLYLVNSMPQQFIAMQKKKTSHMLFSFLSFFLSLSTGESTVESFARSKLQCCNVIQ